MFAAAFLESGILMRLLPPSCTEVVEMPCFRFPPFWPFANATAAPKPEPDVLANGDAGVGIGCVGGLRRIEVTFASILIC